MKNFKDFIQTNLVSIVIIMSLVICVLLTVFYVFFENKSQNISQNNNDIAMSFSSKSFSNENEFSTDVIAKLNNPLKIQGYTFKVKFDNTKLNVTNINYVTGTNCIGLSDSNDTLENVNKTGVIKICGEIQLADGTVLPATTENKLVTLKFISLNNTSSEISYDQASDNSLFKIDNNNFIVRQKASSYNSLSSSNN